MPPDPSAGQIDLAQLCVAAFVVFFLGLIYYLRREDKREGYPLELPRPRGGRLGGFPPPPPPKVFVTMHEGEARMPHDTLQGAETDASQPSTLPFLAARPTRPWDSRFLGAPLEPTGDPLRDGIGPAAFSLRRAAPLMTRDGQPQVVPLRCATDWSVTHGDLDPRGLPVVAADGGRVGLVVDLWVDRGVKILRYMEVEAPDGGRRMLLPIYFAAIGRREIRVTALRAAQFAELPRLRRPDIITAREEDRINAYYAGGPLYAWHNRKEPAL